MITTSSSEPEWSLALHCDQMPVNSQTHSKLPIFKLLWATLVRFCLIPWERILFHLEKLDGKQMLQSACNHWFCCCTTLTQAKMMTHTFTPVMRIVGSWDEWMLWTVSSLLSSSPWVVSLSLKKKKAQVWEMKMKCLMQKNQWVCVWGRVKKNKEDKLSNTWLRWENTNVTILTRS